MSANEEEIPAIARWIIVSIPLAWIATFIVVCTQFGVRSGVDNVIVWPVAAGVCLLLAVLSITYLVCAIIWAATGKWMLR